jgi:hypothetical protein
MNGDEELVELTSALGRVSVAYAMQRLINVERQLTGRIDELTKQVVALEVAMDNARDAYQMIKKEVGRCTKS